tara:strand:+ start:21801 stop:22385 length:585 start_codon:yes stop_codon:yes gene_type:complete
MGVRIEFGTYLKSIREEQLISQDKLAEKSGLLRYQIIAIEKGKSNYTIDNLFKYLHGLNVSHLGLEVLAFTEQFEFKLTGSTMHIDEIRELLAEKITYHTAWDQKLDDTEPGHYGINSSEVEISSEDIFVNIPQRRFEFKNAQFNFEVNLMSSKDGITHQDLRIASGEGSFEFVNNREISIEELLIEVDLDLMA